MEDDLNHILGWGSSIANALLLLPGIYYMIKNKIDDSHWTAQKILKDRLIPQFDNNKNLGAFGPQNYQIELQKQTDTPYYSATMAMESTFRALKGWWNPKKEELQAIQNGFKSRDCNIISFGSSLSTPVCKDQMEISKVRDCVPLTFEHWKDAPISHVKRVSMGINYEEDIYRIIGNGDFRKDVYNPQIDTRSQVLRRDYFLWSVLPNQLSKADSFYHMNQGGLTGIGTRLSKHILNNVSLLREIADYVNEKEFFQVVASVPVCAKKESGIIFDHEPQTKSTKLEAVYCGENMASEIKWKKVDIEV